MKRIALILLMMSSFLYSRENPFAPVENLKDTPATNVEEMNVEFSSKTTQLPSNARVLKYVTYGYQALDGSLQTQKILINEKIDWHDPLILTRESSIITLVEEKKDIIPTPPTSLSQTNVENNVKKTKTIVKFEDFITFEVDKKTLYVKTSDKNLRHFMVVKPYKIVLDFERDTSFYTRKLKVNQPPFSEVQMGNHDGYYRAAIWLDGPYKYNVETKEDGVLITLN